MATQPKTKKKRAQQAKRPGTRNIKLQTRANEDQMKIILSKAGLYFGNNVSELLLQGALAYKGNLKYGEPEVVGKKRT